MPEGSYLQRMRQVFLPKLPRVLLDLSTLKAVHRGSSTAFPQLKSIFPKTCSLPRVEFEPDTQQSHAPLCVGVVLSGGQAAGGHNVISGLFDALTKLNPESRLIGFLDGPSGIVDNKVIELTEETIAPFRNQGGFDLIGSGRTKIETPEQFASAAKTATERHLDGLVVVGGDDSNTNAALLAEYFEAYQIPTRVVGVPKTIDGDLKNEHIEVSFGFDTATKTFAEIIGNIARDSLSAKKYYFFIKLMGRSASHIALECALQTHPNLTFIGEEVAAQGKTLRDLTTDICDVITARAERGKNYGVVLIPEGIVEFIPEFKVLIAELNRMEVDAKLAPLEKIASVRGRLGAEARQCFDSIPSDIQGQLLLDRDPHGNVQVSKIESERLFIHAVKCELQERKKSGAYLGKFSAQPLFCGYEGRSCYPSNFDCEYCYALGHVAALLIDAGATGYMSCVQKLARPVDDWAIAGIPLTGMITMEERKGQKKPVIQKAMVNLEDQAFAIFKEHRARWAVEDEYRYPGPIQFFGPPAATDIVTSTLESEADFCCEFSDEEL